MLLKKEVRQIVTLTIISTLLVGVVIGTRLITSPKKITEQQAAEEVNRLRHHIHTFGPNYDDPSKPDTYAYEQRHANVMGYSMVSSGKPEDEKFRDIGVLKAHNALVFPINLRSVNSENKTYLYSNFYHREFDNTAGQYKSAFESDKLIKTRYAIDPNIIEFIKNYACAKPNVDLSLLTVDTLSLDLLDLLFHPSWVVTEKDGTTSMTLMANWQNKNIVNELVEKTIVTINNEEVNGIFFDQFGAGPKDCSNAYLPGGDVYTGYREGQKDLVARITNRVRQMSNQHGNPYFVTVNVAHPFIFSGARAAEYYTDGSFRADHYYFERGNIRENDETKSNYREIISPIIVNGVVPGGEPDAGKPAFVYYNNDGSVKWYLPAYKTQVDTEGGWYTTLGVRDRGIVGTPYREDDYRDENNCYPLPVEDDYFTQHLKVVGMAGKQGSWFGWYKGWLAHEDFYICENGKPRLKTEEKELVYTNDRQLMQAIPNWDNLLNIPVPEFGNPQPDDERKWDSVNLVYQSTNSYASKDVIYSRHFETGELFLTFVTLSGEVTLKTGETVKSAYFVNEYFEKTMEDARGCLNINGNKVKLKPECSEKLKTGIRISSAVNPYTNGLVSRWSFNETSGDAIDSVSGNNGQLVNGVARTSGIDGSALEFDGVDDFVFIGDVLDMHTSDMSVSFWVKTTSDTHAVIISKAFSVPYYNIIKPWYDKVRMDLHNGVDTAFTKVDSTTLINDGEWHHVAAVYDRDDKAHIYVDGNEENSVDISKDAKVVISNPSALAFGTNCKFAAVVDGKCKDNFNSQLQGSLDEVKFYNKTLTANEVIELYNEFNVTPTPTPIYTTQTTEVRVNSGTDDAEESAGGSMYLNSSDLELVYTETNQTVGIRFNNLNIPQGAAIENAYIQFQTDERTSSGTLLNIQGEAVDTAPAFTSSSSNISSRGRTTASVSWSPPAWDITGEAGLNQQTPNIAPVIQEIVNRPGWVSGNSLVIIITGTGKRTAEAFEGDPSRAALLHIEASLSPNLSPTPILSPSPTPTTTPSPTLTPTPTPTSPPSTVTLKPIADSYVDQRSPSKNYGARSELEVDGRPVKIVYFKFDLSSLAGETIKSAKLRIKITNSSRSLQTVRLVNDTSWNEYAITYYYRPLPSATITSFNGGSRGNWVEVDITNATSQKVGGLFSFLIDSSGNNGLDFYSREASSDTPELVVEY